MNHAFAGEAFRQGISLGRSELQPPLLLRNRGEHVFQVITFCRHTFPLTMSSIVFFANAPAAARSAASGCFAASA